MNKLFRAQLTIYGLISHLQIIHSSYYAWLLNVLLQLAVQFSTSRRNRRIFFGTAAAEKIFG